MKCLFFLNLAFLALAAGSCTKEQVIAHHQPETPVASAPAGTPSGSFGITATEWYPTYSNNFRSVITLATGQVGSLRLFILIWGDYVELGLNQVDFMGGELWYETHADEHVLFFHSDTGHMPFYTLPLQAIAGP
jgi:hypothetical protein